MRPSGIYLRAVGRNADSDFLAIKAGAWCAKPGSTF